MRKIKELKNRVADCLESLRDEVGIPDNWLITFIARNPDDVEQEMVVSQDAFPEILNAISRAAKREEIE